MKQKYIEEQKEEVEMSMHDKPALKALEEENSQRQSHLERQLWWRMKTHPVQEVRGFFSRKTVKLSSSSVAKSYIDDVDPVPSTPRG